MLKLTDGKESDLPDSALGAASVWCCVVTGPLLLKMKPHDCWPNRLSDETKQAGGNPDEMQETCRKQEPSRQWQTATGHVLAHASAEGRGRVRKPAALR